MSAPEAARRLFWAKVASGSPSECWIWTGGTTAGGYGRFSYGYPQVKEMAHRFAYADKIATIPTGLQLDHLCRNRACVNPAHLEPVTPRENLMRGQTITARNAAKTHCNRGHAFDEGNTYLAPNGTRNCRVCRQEAVRRHRGRARQEQAA